MLATWLQHLSRIQQEISTFITEFPVPSSECSLILSWFLLVTECCVDAEVLRHLLRITRTNNRGFFQLYGIHCMSNICISKLTILTE
jgi:hypothetical protein